MDIRDGEYIEYFENGNIREKCNFVNNTYHGKYESYYENGIMEKSGMYENDEKQGEWLNYTYDEKCKKSYYKNDVLIESNN